MTKPIKGKIAKILSKYAVVLNIGSEHGVVKGMKFSVKSIPFPIFDPDTNEEIGKMTVEIAKIEVDEVFEKYSVASTYVYEGTSSLPFPSAFTTTRTRQKLDVDPSDLVSPDTIIKAGNTVEQIIED